MKYIKLRVDFDEAEKETIFLFWYDTGDDWTFI